MPKRPRSALEEAKAVAKKAKAKHTKDYGITEEEVNEDPDRYEKKNGLWVTKCNVEARKANADAKFAKKQTNGSQYLRIVKTSWKILDLGQHLHVRHLGLTGVVHQDQSFDRYQEELNLTVPRLLSEIAIATPGEPGRACRRILQVVAIRCLTEQLQDPKLLKFGHELQSTDLEDALKLIRHDSQAITEEIKKSKESFDRHPYKERILASMRKAMEEHYKKSKEQSVNGDEASGASTDQADAWDLTELYEVLESQDGLMARFKDLAI